MSENISKRKAEHIRIVLDEKVTGDTITTGLEDYHFIHNALPEVDFNEIDLTTQFLSYQTSPFLISSMTGGAAMAETINRHLAMAAEEKRWILALGSTRALIENSSYRSSFQLRTEARSTPIIANLGAVQLNYGFTVDECRKIMEWTDANMLVLHLNSLQEVIQNGGDTNFKSLLEKIANLCTKLEVPVGVKEVGWGIDGEVALKLRNAGVAFIDVAGAGGTSWSQVEKYRAKDPIKSAAADIFSDWGNPTSWCINSVREKVPGIPLIASGGMRSGLDAAKSLALQADLVGFGRSILKEATESVEEVLRVMETIELELKMAMFGIGVSTIADLRRTDRLKKKGFIE